MAIEGRWRNPTTEMHQVLVTSRAGVEIEGSTCGIVRSRQQKPDIRERLLICCQKIALLRKGQVGTHQLWVQFATKRTRSRFFEGRGCCSRWTRVIQPPLYSLFGVVCLAHCRAIVHRPSVGWASVVGVWANLPRFEISILFQRRQVHCHLCT